MDQNNPSSDSSELLTPPHRIVTCVGRSAAHLKRNLSEV